MWFALAGLMGCELSKTDSREPSALRFLLIDFEQNLIAFRFFVWDTGGVALATPVGLLSEP
jgi:hypothetical protein